MAGKETFELAQQDSTEVSAILADADLILEFFANRSGYVEHVEALFDTMQQSDELQVYITDHCLGKVRFYLSRQDDSLGDEAVTMLETIFEGRIISINQSFIERARHSPLKDFESAVEAVCAIERDLNAIVTLTPEKFSGVDLPIWEVEQWKENFHQLTEKICQLAVWPKDKPVAQIVFPQVLKRGTEEIAAVWVMLPEKEMNSLLVNQLYNRIHHKFLCSMSPHPIILWLTIVYNRSHSQKSVPRLLRCYLDLKTAQGQEMIRLLGERGVYRILLFALESPEQCTHSIDICIHSSQRSCLKQWAISSSF
jgi:hypothetical protein